MSGYLPAIHLEIFQNFTWYSSNPSGVLPRFHMAFFQEFTWNGSRNEPGISLVILQDVFGSSPGISPGFHQKLTRNSSETQLRIDPEIPQEFFRNSSRISIGIHQALFQEFLQQFTWDSARINQEFFIQQEFFGVLIRLPSVIHLIFLQTFTSNTSRIQECLHAFTWSFSRNFRGIYQKFRLESATNSSKNSTKMSPGIHP